MSNLPSAFPQSPACQHQPLLCMCMRLYRQGTWGFWLHRLHLMNGPFFQTSGAILGKLSSLCLFFFFSLSLPHPPPPSTASLLDLQRDWKQAELISSLVLHSAASVSFSAAPGSAQSCSLSLFALSVLEGSSSASCCGSGAGIQPRCSLSRLISGSPAKANAAK